MTYAANFDKPDWVILGVPSRQGDGKLLVASVSLAFAEVRVQFVRPDRGESGAVVKPVPGYLLTAGMPEASFQHGATYREAFASLFDRWSPDAPARALESGSGE